MATGNRAGKTAIDRGGTLKAIERADDVSDESDWPDDLPAAIFIGRAFRIFGQAQHGNGWTGRENSVDPGPAWSLSSFDDIAWREQRAAETILKRFEPAAYEIVTSDWNNKDIITEENWSIVLEHQNEIVAAAARWKNTAKYIVDKLRSDSLKCYRRDHETGELVQLGCSLWNYEDYRTRFEMWSINIDDPFSRDTAYRSDRTYDWLYVDRTELKNIVGRSYDFPLSEADWDALSPYMKILLRASARLNLGREPDPSVATIQSTIRDLWDTTPAQPTQNMLDMMATILRRAHNHSQGGKPKKNRSEPR